MGHMKIKIGGKLCKCGAKGCFEAYTSKNALIDAYNESGNSINEVEEFEDLYNINDETIKKVLTEYIDILGAGISNLTMLFDPKIIDYWWRNQ